MFKKISIGKIFYRNAFLPFVKEDFERRTLR